MARDPFNFDMRASTDKKKKSRGRRGLSGAVETSAKQCQHPGCEETGQYRAPRARDQLDDYLWFCKEHVREYNLKWNFFDGQTEAETQATMEQDRVWGKTAQPFGSKAREAKGWARHGIDDPHQVLGDKATQRRPEHARPGGTVTRRLPPGRTQGAGGPGRARHLVTHRDSQAIQRVGQRPAPGPERRQPRRRGAPARGGLGLGSDQGIAQFPRRGLSRARDRGRNTGGADPQGRPCPVQARVRFRPVSGSGPCPAQARVRFRRRRVAR